MDAKIKITVLRRTRHEDLLARYATHIWEPRERLSEGQEFVAEGANMPLGFCSWAWCDIQKYVLTLARGGDFIGSRPGVTVACCSDGFRPVIFKLERLEPAAA
jgi:uncharacterized repeat protein (TIGR04076 family)